ncbi:MAG: GNAT family N-acetyltransferase [Candidatus Hodarchaeales archaeon]
MDVTIQPLTKTYYLPLEKIYIQIAGNFDNPFDLDNFRGYIRFRSNLIKIAVHSSKIVGYIIGDQNSSFKTRIFSLYVLPDFQRRKIGSDLLRALEREFLIQQPNLRYLSVRIPEKFFDSKNFFLTQKFEIITKINYYVKNDLLFPHQINSSVEIRSATKKDLQDLINLERICFSEYWQKNKKEFKKEIESKTISLFVAILDGKLVGYTTNFVSASGTNGQYARIATHPEFRRNRIGTTLTSKAFQWYKKQGKVQKVVLTTFADSDIHNAMYQGWGFEFLEQEMIMAKKYD